MKHWIDCGGHQGHATILFCGFHPEAKEFKKHAFEPNDVFNPFWVKGSPYKALHDADLHNAAVWTHTGEVKMYLSQNQGQLGSTLLHGKKTGNVDYSRHITVPCIDFSSWLEENVKKEDKVLVKMNIEGSEYAILGKLIKSGTIKLIDELYLSTHGKKIDGFSEEQDNRLIKKVRSYGVKVILWDMKGENFKNLLRWWLCGTQKAI